MLKKKKKKDAKPSKQESIMGVTVGRCMKTAEAEKKEVA